MNSSLSVYFLHPLYLQKVDNENPIDSSSRNIEHIIPDSKNNVHTPKLSNLILLPSDLNENPKDNGYTEKRQKYLNCNIPYVVNFANTYTQFNEKNVNERTHLIANELDNIYSIDNTYIENRILQD